MTTGTLDAWVQQTRDRFDQSNDGPLAPYYRGVSVWQDDTLVIDFELNGVFVGVDIAPTSSSDYAVDLVVRVDQLGIDWSMFGTCDGTHVRVLTHENGDSLPGTLDHIEAIVLRVRDASDAHMQEVNKRLEKSVQEATEYFQDPSRGQLATYLRRVWVWETQTLVIDFEFNRMRIGVNINPADDGKNSVDLVLRADELGIDWSRFGKRTSSFVRIFSYPSSETLLFALKQIEEILYNVVLASNIRLEELNHHRLHQGLVSRFHQDREEFSFFVENPRDTIQSCHSAGHLYEIEELHLIKKYSRKADVFYDIGSNVGNHAIYISKVLQPRLVVAFEANPFTVEMLKINIALNGLNDCIDTSHLGVGLGDKDGRFTLQTPTNNLGATRLRPSAAQADNSTAETSVAVRPLDSLSLKRMPDFVKIDVEGMEISVLLGMRNVIEKAHPRMFIEVDNTNASAFQQWITSNDYVVVDRFKRYASNENFMIIHRSELARD